MKIIKQRGIGAEKLVPHEKVAETILDAKRARELDTLNRLGFGNASKTASSERLRLLARITVEEALAIEQEILADRHQEALWKQFYQHCEKNGKPDAESVWGPVRRMFARAALDGGAD